jgi:hypothetical protein
LPWRRLLQLHRCESGPSPPTLLLQMRCLAGTE